MQISSTEDSDYIYKSQYIQLPVKRLYLHDLLIADEGCLINLFVDVLQVVKKREMQCELILIISSTIFCRQRY